MIPLLVLAGVAVVAVVVMIWRQSLTASGVMLLAVGAFAVVGITGCFGGSTLDGRSGGYHCAVYDYQHRATAGGGFWYRVHTWRDCYQDDGSSAHPPYPHPHSPPYDIAKCIWEGRAWWGDGPEVEVNCEYVGFET